MKIVRFPQALSDLVEVADYLAEADPAIADRFFDAFEATLSGLRRNPKIGSVRELQDGTEVRMWFVRKFQKVLIFYTRDLRSNSHTPDNPLGPRLYKILRFRMIRILPAQGESVDLHSGVSYHPS